MRTIYVISSANGREFSDSNPRTIKEAARGSPRPTEREFSSITPRTIEGGGGDSKNKGCCTML